MCPLTFPNLTLAFSNASISKEVKYCEKCVSFKEPKAKEAKPRAPYPKKVRLCITTQLKIFAIISCKVNFFVTIQNLNSLFHGVKMKFDRRSEPYNFILSYTSALQAGSRVLFLGKEHDKNAVILAKLGVHVEVLDSDDKALLAVQEAAREANVFLITRHTRLEYWQVPHTYDAIILGNFPLSKSKHRTLFDKILSALAPRGIFVAKSWKDEVSKDSEQDPYNFISLYTLFQDLPCQLLKIDKELIGNRYLIRAVLQKN